MSNGLARDEKRHLFEAGWVQVRDAVPRTHVRAALKAINASLGAGLDPRQMDVFRNQSFCPELREAPVIGDLYAATRVRGLVESALGEGNVFVHPRAQIALRFPILRDAPPAPTPHVDGFYTAANGVGQGTIATFSGIVGVFLSDVIEERAGNLTVWSGTHTRFAEYYRHHAPDPSLPDGIPPVALPAPRELTVRAGDVVIAHYMLAHTASPNVCADVRYAVYFRFQHVNHVATRPSQLTDPWGEWAGMRDVT